MFLIITEIYLFFVCVFCEQKCNLLLDLTKYAPALHLALASVRGADPFLMIFTTARAGPLLWRATTLSAPPAGEAIAVAGNGEIEAIGNPPEQRPTQE